MWKIVTEFIQQRGDGQSLSPKEEIEKHENQLNDSRNFYLKGVTFSIHHSQQISVGISKMQGLTNSLRVTENMILLQQFNQFHRFVDCNLQKFPKHLIKESLEFERALGMQIIMLAPLAPHFASELWTAFVDHAARKTDDFDWVTHKFHL